MSSIASIVCLLLVSFLNLTFAEENISKYVNPTLIYAYSISIITISVFITLIFTGFTYMTVKYIKKRSSSPPEYHQHQFEDAHIHRIQPIISVSDVVTSMKQSLEELGAVVVPKRSQLD